MSSTILAIDPGTAITGWAVVKPAKKSGGSPEVKAYGVIRTKAGLPDEERLAQIFDELNKLVEEFKPTAVSIEKVFFNTNVKTAMSVGQSRGVILLMAAQNGLRVKEYTPLQVKTAVCGYGRADKKQVQEMVKRLYHLKELPKPDDAADALAVALCYIFDQTPEFEE